MTGAGETSIKRFTVYRRADISATHDENQRNHPDLPQFEGIVFTDGTCVIRWLTFKRSTSIFNTIDDMITIHGHPEYDTELVFHD